MKLKELAKKGFITKSVIVPEWDSATVIIREPMHIAFNHYMVDVEKVKSDESLSVNERDQLLVKAEAKLFTSVLFDTDYNPVFTDSDVDELSKTYGPIHTRLLNQAIGLIGLGNEPIKEAEKK